VFFRDPDSRDGIDCSRISAHRLAKDCYNGCALECSQPKCALGIHVSCGLGAGLCIEYQEGKGAPSSPASAESIPSYGRR
jgi:NuA3 HAT complex component NTO1